MASAEHVEEVLARIDEAGIELVRFVYADQHGLLRGKTLARASVPAALRDGFSCPSSLLLKDLSGRSVFSPFSADPGVGADGFSGAGDFFMAPDLATFHALPWAPRTGQVLCDVRYAGGDPVPFCTRSVLRQVLGSVAERGWSLTIGPELEFHVFRDPSPQVTVDQVGQPGAPGAAPAVLPSTAGAQLHHIDTIDRLDDVVQALYDGLTGIGLAVRSLEVEFGHSQLELTLDAAGAMAAADAVVLLRSAVRQICARLGYRATFMSRPAGADTASAGWHLHQSLTDLATGAPVFPPSSDVEVLSETGRRWLAGLLANAEAATAFSTPTVNGYKRYRPFTLAPDRRGWGVENKGAMIRVVSRVGDPASRLENRSGEPGANPYLYIASQAISGLDGVARRLEPEPPTSDPYTDDVPRLPRSLAESLDAVDTSALFRKQLGDIVVDWYLGLKRAEFDRYLAHVSDWEQREYLDLL